MEPCRSVLPEAQEPARGWDWGQGNITLTFRPLCRSQQLCFICFTGNFHFSKLFHGEAKFRPLLPQKLRVGKDLGDHFVQSFHFTDKAIEIPGIYHTISEITPCDHMLGLQLFQTGADRSTPSWAMACWIFLLQYYEHVFVLSSYFNLSCRDYIKVIRGAFLLSSLSSLSPWISNLIYLKYPIYSLLVAALFNPTVCGQLLIIYSITILLSSFLTEFYLGGGSSNVPSWKHT